MSFGCGLLLRKCLLSDLLRFLRWLAYWSIFIFLEIAANQFRLFSASFSVESVVYAIVARVQSIATNGFCVASQAPSR